LNRRKNTRLSFEGQHFFIGIEVHKSKYVITIRCNQVELKKYVMDPNPVQLAKYMNKNYPEGTYHSVYEAGFCGFSLHEKLTELGFDSMVANPADIPTTQKEKVNKNDTVDSRKLSRERENGSLTSIYIPDEYHRGMRGLSRLRKKTMGHIVRIKNRTTSHLYFNGIRLSLEEECSTWSKKYIAHLMTLELDGKGAKDYLKFCLQALASEQILLSQIVLQTLTHLRNDGKDKIIELLRTVPGIGITSAVVLYLELMDINRFPHVDNLCSFFGLIPSTADSGEKKVSKGITPRRNRFLRHIIIEAAWIAIRKDPALLLYFNKCTLRMKKQNAIIKVAKKLVSRIRYVWKNESPYVYGLVG